MNKTQALEKIKNKFMQFTKKSIIEYANRYDKHWKGTPDELVENELKKWFKKNKYLTKEKFVKLGLWKSPRPKKSYENNNANLIEEITKSSFKNNNEEAKLKILMILRGVSYPVASVILHFAFPDKYPIMDFRAIWSLGWSQSKSYDYKFWLKYCEKIRKIAKKFGVSIRTLDKALWQYSKENQRRIRGEEKRNRRNG